MHPLGPTRRRPPQPTEPDSFGGSIDERDIVAEISGTCDPKFAEVRAILDANLDSGADVGASVHVTVGGRPVVDLWGGWVDPEHTGAWTEHTITNVWSTTKTMSALAALMLVDRGLLDVDEPVATYWPEFAANGKDGVLVRHVLSHTSGVSGWEQPFELADMFDPIASAAHLAAQAPWWSPGTASGYHAINYGHFVSELSRRVDGRGLKQFVAEEMAEPLGADFQIGAVEVDWPRVSDVIPPTGFDFDLTDVDLDGPMIKTFTGGFPGADFANTPGWRLADIGAANGHGNARAVARIQQVVANGGTVDGVRLLGPDTIELIFREQAHGKDLVLNLPLRFGIGYGLRDETSLSYLPEGRVCFWGGWGGSMIVMDLDRQLAICYVMNRMESRIIGCPRSEAIIAAVDSALT